MASGGAGEMQTEVDRLRSELWRVYEVLGFDTDGDTHHSVVDLGDVVIAAAEQYRRESESEIGCLEQDLEGWQHERDALRERNRRLKEANDNHHARAVRAETEVRRLRKEAAGPERLEVAPTHAPNGTMQPEPVLQDDLSCDHLGTEWVSEPITAANQMPEHRCARCGRVVLRGIPGITSAQAGPETTS